METMQEMFEWLLAKPQREVSALAWVSKLNYTRTAEITLANVGEENSLVVHICKGLVGEQGGSDVHRTAGFEWNCGKRGIDLPLRHRAVFSVDEPGTWSGWERHNFFTNRIVACPFCADLTVCYLREGRVCCRQPLARSAVNCDWPKDGGTFFDATRDIRGLVNGWRSIDGVRQIEAARNIMNRLFLERVADGDLVKLGRCPDCAKSNLSFGGFYRNSARRIKTQLARTPYLESDDLRDMLKRMFPEEFETPKQVTKKAVIRYIRKRQRIRPLSPKERNFFSMVLGAQKLSQITRHTERKRVKCK